jgi:hypothetical protein
MLTARAQPLGEIRRQGGIPELLEFARLPEENVQAAPLPPRGDSPADRLLKITREEQLAIPRPGQTTTTGRQPSGAPGRADGNAPHSDVRNALPGDDENIEPDEDERHSPSGGETPGFEKPGGAGVRSSCRPARACIYQPSYLRKLKLLWEGERRSRLAADNATTPFSAGARAQKI